MAGLAVRMTADISQLTGAFGRAANDAEVFKAKIVQTGNAASKAFNVTSAGVKSFAGAIGTGLTSLGRLSSVASSSAAILSKFSQGNDELKKRFESLTITLAILAPALSALGPAIAFLTGPIGLVVAGIGAAILVFRNFEAVSTAVVNTAARVWATLGEFFTGLWRGIAEGARGLGAILLAAMTLDTAGIQAGFAQMMSGFKQVKGTMVTAASGIASGIGSVTAKLQEFVGGIGQANKAADEMLAKVRAVAEAQIDIFAGIEQAREAAAARAAAIDAAEVARQAEVRQLNTQAIVEAAERQVQANEEAALRIAEIQMAKDAAAEASVALEQERAIASGGILAGLFGKSKQFAIAEALVSTFMAVTKALANPPGPPFSIPQAIAAGAFGLAKVAQIKAVGLAEGGIITEPIIAGEAGPEAIIPLTGSRGRDALAGLGVGVIRIEVPVHLDGRLVAKSMVEHIPGVARTRGGIRRV